MTPIVVGLTLASCATTPKFGQVPTSQQVRIAVDTEEFLAMLRAVNCEGRTECYNSRPKTRVRNVRCRQASAGIATCTYKYATEADWIAASADFKVDLLLDGQPGWRVAKPTVN